MVATQRAVSFRYVAGSPATGGIIVKPRPFRFGVLGESVRSAAELVDTARRAEIAGYATFLIRDHFIEEPFGHQLAPVAALATVAAATETLRVGSLVMCNDYRHPVLLAKEVATLDLLSGGRLVASLRRPGGNVTGMTSISSDLAGKRLELVRLVAPRASHVAILWDERNPASRLAVQETEAAARTLGLTLKNVPVRTPADFEPAFSTLVRDRAAALSITSSPMLFPHRQRLAELAMKHRLPTVAGDRAFVDAGCLAAYGTDYPNLFRRAATFVDKILKGAKPGDLPIEQPTKFELVINLKTAKALGLTISSSLLQRADHIIQ